MLIVGERINSSRNTIGRALEERDEAFIIREAQIQKDAGANMLDVNCALNTKDEVSDMQWLVKLVQNNVDIPLSIDSPNPDAIGAGLSKHKGTALINSVTLEPDRVRSIMPFAKKFNAKLIVLLIDENGMPETAQDRLKMAKRALEMAKEYNVPTDNIFIDPLIRPISSEPSQAFEVIKSVRLLRAELNLKSICGLSNVSYGLPDRSILNSVYLAMMLSAGLEGAILDPVNKKISIMLKASNAILGKDEYCVEYIKSFREGNLKF